MPDFTDQVALVTGGAGGIGEQIARGFGAAGGSVVVADVDAEGAETTAAAVTEHTAGEAVAVETDVTDEDSVAALVDTTVTEFGGLDAAVNNAAIAGENDYLATYPAEEFRRVLDVNLLGVFHSLQHELRAMESGAIVNLSSVLGRVGYERACGYVAAKHGVVGLTRTAALEYADQNIRVNAVCPGFIETDMLDDAGVNQSERTREHVRGLHPMDRFGGPEEIADAVVWLCSEESSFVTGTALPVDGGYTSR